MGAAVEATQGAEQVEVWHPVTVMCMAQLFENAECSRRLVLAAPSTVSCSMGVESWLCGACAVLTLLRERRCHCAGLFVSCAEDGTALRFVLPAVGCDLVAVHVGAQTKVEVRSIALGWTCCWLGREVLDWIAVLQVG